MNVLGGGLINIIIYAMMGEIAAQDDTILTENNFDLLTESGLDLLRESA